jgi:DNA polymerase-4
MDILGRYTDLVEPLSIDEAFLDVTGSRQLFGDGESIARRLKQEVLAEEQLVASVGVAPSKFVAKIASDLEKPDGLVVVPAAGVVEFLRPLPLQRLFGAGPKTLQRLRSIGVTTIGEVAALEEEALAALLSPRMAHHFRELALGRDSRAVVPDREQKSLGREHTFLIDLDDREEVQRTLLGLLEEVTARLRRQGLYGRTVTLKLRDEDFQTVTRSQTLERAVHTTDELWPTVQELLRRADRTRKAIRLVGVSLSQLSGQQAELFTDPQTGAAQRVAQAQDAIRRRFGSDSLRRGRLLRSPGKTTSKDPSTGPDEPNHGKNASS